MTVKPIRGTDFGPVWVASGALNFFGDGWPQHKKLRLLFGDRFDYAGATFVAKTTTAYERAGNMPLRSNLMPKKILPDCIYVSPRSWLHGSMLNAVGLSGPGVEYLASSVGGFSWYSRTEPFMISFMPVGSTPAERMDEVRFFVKILLDQWRKHGGFNAPVAIQLNLSCPNTGHAIEEFEAEVLVWMDELSQLGVPILYKFSVTTDAHMAVRLCSHPSCDGICISNTVPWGQLPYDPDTNAGIPWQKIFGCRKSPLAKYGGGGYSGKYLLPLVISWIRKFKFCCAIYSEELRNRLHINAGGGILHPADVERLLYFGAHSVSIGAISILRPHRLQATIYRAHCEVYDRPHYVSDWTETLAEESEEKQSEAAGVYSNTID